MELIKLCLAIAAILYSMIKVAIAMRRLADNLFYRDRPSEREMPNYLLRKPNGPIRFRYRGYRVYAVKDDNIIKFYIPETVPLSLTTASQYRVNVTSRLSELLNRSLRNYTDVQSMEGRYLFKLTLL